MGHCAVSQRLSFKQSIKDGETFHKQSNHLNLHREISLVFLHKLAKQMLRKRELSVACLVRRVKVSRLVDVLVGPAMVKIATKRI